LSEYLEKTLDSLFVYRFKKAHIENFLQNNCLTLMPAIIAEMPGTAAVFAIVAVI
jgi:hypothetical protein